MTTAHAIDHASFDAMPLLAKSVPKGHSAASPGAWHLHQHLHDTAQVAEVICEVSGPSILQNLGLPTAPWLPRLREALRWSTRLHDLGKANSRFQAMVHGLPALTGPQTFRHEALSAYVALHPLGLRSQLFPEDSLAAHPLKACAVLAVLGHHVKYCMRGVGLMPGVGNPKARGATRLLFHHPMFEACVAPLGLTTDIALPSTVTAEHILEGDEGLPGLYDLMEPFEALLTEPSAPFGERPIYDGQSPASALEHPWGRFLAACRVLTVSCDAVASAAPRSGARPEAWLRQALQERAQRATLTKMVRARLGEHSLRPFQIAVGESARRITLLTAGCGSGKTTAAFQWARNAADHRKLFFCHPGTGSTAGGLGDHVTDADVAGELVHGRAAFELEMLHGYPSEDEPGAHDETAEELAGVQGLGLLSSPAVSCTAETVLGLLQHHRQGLWGSAAILDGAFVFDEVHAYDRATWHTLTALMRLLPGARFLLMTATLSARRHKDLEQHFGAELAHISGRQPPFRLLRDLESLARYQIDTAQHRDAALKTALDAARAGKRALMVFNTVERTLAAAKACREALAGGDDAAPRVLVHHPRFKQRDRVARHAELIQAFRRDPPHTHDKRGVIGLVTHVAELSLDLDADVMVSELASPEALIQRLGRLNRDAQPGLCRPRPAIVVDLPPSDAQPYTAQSLERARRWLSSLQNTGHEAFSQRDLADAFFDILTDMDGNTPAPPIPVVNAPIEASRGQLHDSGATATFLMQEDASRIRAAREHRDLAATRRLELDAALTMTLPTWWPSRSWARLGMAYVIPDDAFIEYDALHGARWISHRTRDGQ